MDIAEWRKKIDGIDRELVRLLNERARCAAEIGRIKRKKLLPIHDPAREMEVLRQVEELNEGPLHSDSLRRIFEAIMQEGRTLERRLLDAEREQAK